LAIKDLINLQKAEIINGNLIIRDQNGLIVSGNQLLTDQTGKITIGNTLTQVQTAQVISGNATSDVIKNLSNLNASYSEGMLRALVQTGGAQSNTLQAVLNANTQTVTLLSQLVAMTRTSTALAEAAAAAAAAERAREEAARQAAEAAAEAARQAQLIAGATAAYNAQQSVAESYRKQWDDFATSRASYAFSERQENIATGTPYYVTGYYSYSDAERAWLSQTVAAYNTAFSNAHALWKAIPGHASGLRSVPYDNYLMRAHKDEAVLTAPEATEWRDYKTGKALHTESNVALIEELRALRSELKAGLYQTAKNTGQTARVLDRTLTKWDEIGLPAEATP